MKSAKGYHKVTIETIEALKQSGFTHVQFELENSGELTSATVEVIPLKDASFSLDIIPLNGREILDFLEKPSQMAKYFINEKYFPE